MYAADPTGVNAGGKRRMRANSPELLHELNWILTGNYGCDFDCRLKVSKCFPDRKWSSIEDLYLLLRFNASKLFRLREQRRQS